MIRSPHTLVALATLGVGVAVGVFVAAPPTSSSSSSSSLPSSSAAAATAAASDDADAAAAATFWTCSMHPQIRLPAPGACPICGMDLIVAGGSGAGDEAVELSAEAAALASIETAVVERRAVTMSLRLVGKVTYDESRVARLTAWFGGRIERLYVDFTGTVVKKGDHLLAIYSPELLVAQQELLAAARDRRHGGGMLADVAEATYRASRDKLRLWGLQDWQIRSVERRGKPLESVTIYAPMGGVVTHKPAERGAWVQTGTPLYTIADLSRVWVALDAHESDMPWLRFGQRVRVEVDAFAGQAFDGKIAFVDPVMDERKRTIGVRVHVDNPDLRLKPGMFVRAVAEVTLGAEGGAVRAAPAGAYACPMHPDVVADAAGKCSVCGMDLVAAADHWLLGRGPDDAGDPGPPLVIPATAPLQTGKRVVVFVQDPATATPTYRVREVVLGPRAGEVYLVRSGLEVGERVVARGAFRLDSAVQIAGGRSIMAADVAAAGDDDHDHAAVEVAVEVVVEAVALGPRGDAALADALAAALDLSAALAADDAVGAAAPARALAAAVAALIAAAPSAAGAHTDALAAAGVALGAAADLGALRGAYTQLNAVLVPLVRAHEQTLGVPYDHVHCPMADDNRGAGWLQRPGEVHNPYFGAQMLRCGGRKGGHAAVAP